MADEGGVLARDGHWLNDAGHVIGATSVDFRDPADRLPIANLAKLCEKRFAPEIAGTVRISKPESFRNDGETLISDPEETRITRITSHAERINDPTDLAESATRNSESNRAAELAGSTMRRHTTGTKRRKSDTTTRTFGKNCWIFCTAIAPEDEDSEAELWAAMDPRYDHLSFIHRPRAFAFALSSRVADELGPQGREAKWESRIGEFTSTTRHQIQTVFHGPVLYVDDPFEMVERARNDIEAMLVPMFVKRRMYQAQREYRFVIWCDKEPTVPFVDLNVSPSMLGSFQVPMPDVNRPPLDFSSVAHEKRQAKQQSVFASPQRTTDQEQSELPTTLSGEPDGLPSVFDLLNAPGTPVGIFRGESEDTHIEEAELKHQAVRSLRIAVEKVPDDRLVAAASSAFHAEPLILQLCEKFVDPIRSVAISDDNFVVVRINANDWRSGAKFVVGPHGEIAYHLKRQGFQSSGFDVVRHELPLPQSIADELSNLGLVKRSS